MDTDSQAGTLVDLTTLLGAVDCLGFVAETREYPLTHDLLLTAAQFIESLVLHDRLYFEEGATSAWQPYLDLIDHCGIESMLGNSVLSRLQSQIDYERLRLKAIRWAIKQVQAVEMASLRWPVAVRSSSYRSIAAAKAISDTRNPFREEYLAAIRAADDEELETDFRTALRVLASRRVGFLGLNVLIRVFFLREWLSKQPHLTYSPHCSRVPLLQATLLQPERQVSFRRWSFRELDSRRAKLLAQYTQDSENEGPVFRLSPIFLACLASARNPLDILENALRLREDKYARAFRSVCRSLETAAREGAVSEFALRYQVKKALADLAEIVKSRSGNLKAVGKATLHPPWLEGEFSFERTFKLRDYDSSVLFLLNVLRSSLQVLSAKALILRAFGTIPDTNAWVLHRR